MLSRVGMCSSNHASEADKSQGELQGILKRVNTNKTGNLQENYKQGLSFSTWRVSADTEKLS